MSNFAVIVVASSAVVFLATGGYTLVPRELWDPACNIKGNVSIVSRERIYHVPGQWDYVSTNIRRDYGERWFCTEDDAREAGWRKAGR
ncbi:sunset domain-containing protein [Neorhizobium sp. LjRoot104]|uniref:sunset domain-containing protein n=1 Tax=Neorhizobium sp. LjRoot104 TaxID=3342254 RepID=UPI003ED00180